MARDISIAEALAVLAAAEGIELTEEQKSLAAKVARDEMTEAAESVFARKLNNEKDAARWTKDSFTLAEKISAAVKGENVGRGRGEVFEQVFRVETPHGSLKVSLTNEPRK